MKRNTFTIILALCCSLSAWAQNNITKMEGTCGEGINWTFDGYTLFIEKAMLSAKDRGSRPMDDYDTKNKAPWLKKKLSVQRVELGRGISRIGSCAFMGMRTLRSLVIKGQDLTEIGWGAFMDCSSLSNVTLPVSLSIIETLAFARCAAFTYVEIPMQCRVEEQAFVACNNVTSLSIAPTAIIGSYAFAGELSLNGVADHFGVSGKLVGTVCRDAFGKTFLQYVRDCQIQHATELLQTTDLSLEEIAEQCGFTDANYFTRTFKKINGLSPNEFRKSLTAHP